MNWHVLRFTPIYKARVWGGHRLAEQYGRTLPEGRVGESWEVTDRPEGVSVVSEGPLAGLTLTELLEKDAAGLMGEAPTREGRFPLLIKILDAREVLSLQVHPPACSAGALGGEPKTELWYFTGAEPGAEIYAGLRSGTTRQEFERRLNEGTVAECIHRLPVRRGDAMFLPSGRVHALGAGLLLFEVQENSDTTYRVFDWNRMGLDGKPRPLHVPESLASIDFSDAEPGALPAEWTSEDQTQVRVLTDDALFHVEARRGSSGSRSRISLKCCRILGVAAGRVTVEGRTESTLLEPGDFCLVPAALESVAVRVDEDAEWLVITPGQGGKGPPVSGVLR